MKKIDNLSDSASQVTHVVLDDGTVVDITLTYRPTIQRWQLDINHPRLVMNGKILCSHPNLLRQFRHTAGFGLACVVDDGTEAVFIDDFATGRAVLYLLGPSDIDYIESNVFAPTTGVMV